jgi:hypothetical protein
LEHFDMTVTSEIRAEADERRDEQPKRAISPISRIRRRLARPGSRALLVYAILGSIANLPIFPGDATHLPSLVGEDIVQTTWFLEWTPWALLHGQNIFSTHLINYPLGVDVAQNTGIPILGILTAPLTLLVSPVASMNLLRWMAFWLSAYAAYAVIRKWTSWAPAAFIGGLIYGFSPYMAAQGQLHLNLCFVPLPPVILYLIADLVIHQRRPPLKTGLYLGLACAVQFFISSEILVTTLLMAGIGVFVLFFSCIHQVRSRILHAAVGFGVAGALILVVTGYPVWLIFHGSQHYSGPAQGYNSVYNADLLGPIIPTSNQLVAPARLSEIGSTLVGGNIQENGSYLGIPLILAVTVVFVRYWRKLWPIPLAILAVSAFALSLGPVLIVDGRVVHLPFDLPFRKIEHLPGINNILPVRFSLYVVLFVAILIALGTDWYHDDVVARRARSGSDRLSRSAVFARLAGLGLAAVIVASLLPNWPYPTFELRVNPAEQPKSLAIIPQDAVVMTYPYATSFADQAMLWQALDHMRFRLLGSYALVRNKRGTASVAPEVLQPEIVEATFVNSISPVPDPQFPPDEATGEAIIAKRVDILGVHKRRPKAPPGAVLGLVASVDLARGGFVLDETPTVAEGVTLGTRTSYFNLEHRPKRTLVVALAPGIWVAVYGKTEVGTVNLALIHDLRIFLSRNHVDDIVVDLGLRDSWEIGLWVRAAIGRPTRAGHGGLIWTDVPERLRGGSAGKTA